MSVAGAGKPRRLGTVSRTIAQHQICVACSLRRWSEGDSHATGTSGSKTGAVVALCEVGAIDPCNPNRIEGYRQLLMIRYRNVLAWARRADCLRAERQCRWGQAKRLHGCAAQADGLRAV